MRCPSDWSIEVGRASRTGRGGRSGSGCAHGLRLSRRRPVSRTGAGPSSLREVDGNSPPSRRGAGERAVAGRPSRPQCIVLGEGRAATECRGVEDAMSRKPPRQKATSAAPAGDGYPSHATSAIVAAKLRTETHNPVRCLPLRLSARSGPWRDRDSRGPVRRGGGRRYRRRAAVLGSHGCRSALSSGAGGRATPGRSGGRRRGRAGGSRSCAVACAGSRPGRGRARQVVARAAGRRSGS